jgi:hypothetical protein
MFIPRSTAPARQSGRLAARERRNTRPAYSPKVFYSAGRPTCLVECLRSPHGCGPVLTAKIGLTYASYSQSLRVSSSYYAIC